MKSLRITPIKDKILKKEKEMNKPFSRAENRIQKEENKESNQNSQQITNQKHLLIPGNDK